MIVAVGHVDMPLAINRHPERGLKLPPLATVLSELHEGGAHLLVLASVYDEHREGAVLDGLVLYRHGESVLPVDLRCIVHCVFTITFGVDKWIVQLVCRVYTVEFISGA